MKTDIEIARETPKKPIAEIAASLGIRPEELELYGNYKAKITDDFIKRNADKPEQAHFQFLICGSHKISSQNQVLKRRKEKSRGKNSPGAQTAVVCSFFSHPDSQAIPA